jgi:hypothetical protein
MPGKNSMLMCNVSRFRLTLDALGDWLKNPEVQVEGLEGGASEDGAAEVSNSKIRNIWKHDLLLENATDRYVSSAFNVHSIP